MATMKSNPVYTSKVKEKTQLNQGGIYEVPDYPDECAVRFPEEEKRKYEGKRYILVLQNDRLDNDKNYPFLLIIPLTHRGKENEVTVKIPPDFLGDEIPGESYAKISLIQNIHKKRIIRKCGQVPPASVEFKTIKTILKHLIGGF